MKKLIAVLCLIMIACLGLSASAQNIAPRQEGIVRELVSGKTFYAKVSGYGWYGEGEDTRYNLTLTLCERVSFDAAAVEALQPGDTVEINHDVYTLKTVKADEYGVTAQSVNPYDDELCFYKSEDGNYIVANEHDYPYWRETVTFEIEADKGLIFRDWSDPEADDPTDRTIADLMFELSESNRLFDANNTKVTFDENGRLILFELGYSPFN